MKGKMIHSGSGMGRMRKAKLLNCMVAAIVCQAGADLAQAADNRGGRLIYAEPILPDTYDPITTSDNETSLRISELLFESLVYIDYRGEVKGRLAEKWNVFNGNQRITFYLRKDVKWHDGTPFTANDVKFTKKPVPILVEPL